MDRLCCGLPRRGVGSGFGRVELELYRFLEERMGEMRIRGRENMWMLRGSCCCRILLHLVRRWDGFARLDAVDRV